MARITMPAMPNLKLTLCLALALFAGAVHALAEDPRPTALFVIDGSGSMWGRFETTEEKRAKIDVVRDLVRPIISGDQRSRIGLQSFGQRRKGDCSDVEVISAPETDRAVTLQGVDKLNPRGKGPLAESIRKAAQTIGAERPASIIIINDGVDNCRQDACAAAVDAAKTAPGVPIHVIAIGIEPAEQPAVQCIAKTTGGKFYDVRDPVALAAAINDASTLALGSGNSHNPATSETKPDKPQTPEEAAAAVALPQAAVRATLVLADGMKPLTQSATWHLAKKGSDTPLRTLTAAAIAENLEPGDYILSADIEGLSASTPVKVEAGKSTTLALSLKAARLTIKAKAAQDAEPVITVKQASEGSAAGRTVALKRTASLETFLPPATYVVSAASGELRQDKTVKLAEGSEAMADFDLGTGTIALTAALQEGGPAIPNVTFAIQEDDPDSPGGRREVRRSRAPDPRFTLPAGTYYVAARAGFADARQRVALSAGDAVEKTLVLPAADVKITASVGSAAAPESAGLVFRITSLDGEPHEVARVAGPAFTGLLSAGRYRVTAVLQKHGAGVTQDIVVEAGKPQTRVLRIEAGEVALKSTTAVGPETFWEVRDASGKAIWHAAAGEPRVLLAPGRYSVRMEARDKTVEAAFSVAAGESKTVEIGAH